MKAIFKRDFNSYFNSPIGYSFVAIVLAVMAIWFIIYNCIGKAASLSYMFNNSVLVFLFVVPLLSVKMLTEDRKTKTDQILLTAPVTVTEIVLGKYFAALAVYGVALFTSLIYVLIVALFGTLAVGETISTYVGFILLGAAFISIGLYISSLTDNQFLGVLYSFVVLLIMFLLPMVTQFITNPLLASVLNWFAISKRFDGFVSGIFGLDAVIYYVCVCAFFIVLTVFSVEKRRWK